jgi:hypothetical protein
MPAWGLAQSFRSPSQLGRHMTAPSLSGVRLLGCGAKFNRHFRDLAGLAGFRYRRFESVSVRQHILSFYINDLGAVLVPRKPRKTRLYFRRCRTSVGDRESFGRQFGAHSVMHSLFPIFSVRHSSQQTSQQGHDERKQSHLLLPIAHASGTGRVPCAFSLRGTSKQAARE